MKLKLFLVFFSVLLFPSSGLKLIDNGYEDLYVVIQDSVKESDQLIERIKAIFQQASELLYTATQQRAYFRSIVINVPKTWTNKDSYKTVSALSSSTSHIRIGKGNMKKPVTVGSNRCGQKGSYTYLHNKHFVMKTGVTRWGRHDSVIVHEWGHLRWGLKDEYPTIQRRSGNTWHFYPAHGKWNPVGCTRNIRGFASKKCKSGTPDPKCDVNNVSKVIGRKCKFCPEITQTLNASIMSFQYISSVTRFCDKDDPETPEHLRHDSEALNEQNLYCNGKSTWEIMREHEDFRDDNNPALSDDSPPPTTFTIAQETTDKVRVLVLDTSGSMAGSRIDALYRASKLMIEHYLSDGSWLSMVDFDSDAVLLSNFVQIVSNRTRFDLISKLPRLGKGGTCIPCGLDLALSTLKSFKQIDTTREAEVILISDGQNNAGDLEQTTQRLEHAGVVVHCIAVTEAADRRLEDISSRTGGRCFAFAEGGSVSLAALLSEIVSGGTVSGSSAAATMINTQLSVTANVPVDVGFNIDQGIGNDTIVSVMSKDNSNIAIDISGPNNFTHTMSEKQAKSLSLLVAGKIEPGRYTTEITSSESTTLEVIITSKPISFDDEIIRPLVSLSTGQIDFPSNGSLPVIFVNLRKGESPIKNANVTATVYGPAGSQTCELTLLDNGVDPDIKLSDGIYAAYVLRICQGNNGRHTSKVSISGGEKTVVTLYTSSSSAELEDETETVEDMATGSFERVAVPDAYTVINYSTDVAKLDITPPGRITDLEVIDINSGIPSVDLARNYTITWTATGNDLTVGQASSYEMRVSSNLSALRNDFMNGDLLMLSGSNQAPNISGTVERLHMVVSSNDAYTSTTFFAIVAIDEAGNRGPVSNIIPITIGQTSEIQVVKEACTDDCYATVTDCGRSVSIENGHVNISNVASTPGNVALVTCDPGFKLSGGSGIECLENGTWSTAVICEDNTGQQKLTSNSISIPAIIGICLGAGFLFILALIIFFVLKRRYQDQTRKYKIRKIRRNSMIDHVESGREFQSSRSSQEIYKINNKDQSYSNPVY